MRAQGPRRRRDLFSDRSPTAGLLSPDRPLSAAAAAGGRAARGKRSGAGGRVGGTASRTDSRALPVRSGRCRHTTPMTLARTRRLRVYALRPFVSRTIRTRLRQYLPSIRSIIHRVAIIIRPSRLLHHNRRPHTPIGSPTTRRRSIACHPRSGCLNDNRPAAHMDIVQVSFGTRENIYIYIYI